MTGRAGRANELVSFRTKMNCLGVDYPSEKPKAGETRQRGTEASALGKAASSPPSESRLPHGLNIVNCYFAMFNRSSPAELELCYGSGGRGQSVFQE